MNKTPLLNNNKGSAIVTVLFLFVALVGYTLYHIFSVKIAADIKMKSQNDTTVVAITAKIRSALSTPANCNATFSTGTYGASGVLPSIRQCSPGDNCFSGTGTPSEIVKVETTSWNPTVTLINPANVRLIDIKFVRQNLQTAYVPDLVSITLTFEKKLRNGVTSKVDTFLEQYVVYDTVTNTIKGCPRAPNTVDIYGDLSCHVPWNFEQKVAHGSSVPAYKFPHVVGCSLPANLETRSCLNTELAGTYMYENCINDGGWSTSTHFTGPCVCTGGGSGLRPRAYNSCNNPTPDPGGLPCPGTGVAPSATCSLPLAVCPY
jgi:hypothetical protein